MRRTELKKLITECYREVLRESPVMDKVHVEYDAETKTRILHLPEDMTTEQFKQWLDKNKSALNKKYPKAKKK